MAQILIVDPDQPTRELLQALFRCKGHTVRVSTDGPTALAMLEGGAPELVVTEVVMPRMDGFSFVRELRKRKSCRQTAVLFMSAVLHAGEARALAVRCGALGLIEKPVEAIHMLLAAEAALSVKQPFTPRTDDCDFTELQRTIFADALGRKAADLDTLNRELAERTAQLESANAALREQVNRDPLTGMFNRRYFDDTLPRELQRCHRAKIPLTLVLLDLDRFKQINDSHGHHVGDLVLEAAARHIQSALRLDDIAARYGGEEFALVLPGAAPETGLLRIESIRGRIASGDACPEVPGLRFTLSAGIAASPADGLDAAHLLAAADRALYDAKARGRNRVQMHGA